MSNNGQTCVNTVVTTSLSKATYVQTLSLLMDAIVLVVQGVNVKQRECTFHYDLSLWKTKHTNKSHFNHSLILDG